MTLNYAKFLKDTNYANYDSNYRILRNDQESIAERFPAEPNKV